MYHVLYDKKIDKVRIEPHVNYELFWTHVNQNEVSMTFSADT